MNWFVTIGGIAYNFVIIAVCSILILYRRKKANTSEDFLFGGKQMGWFACAASIALTALGGGHINGLSYQSWLDGVAVIWYCFGAGLCLVIIMRWTGIWYRRSGCNTVNEMFGKLIHPALTPVLSGFCVGYCWLILCVETQGLANIIASLTGLSNLTGGVIGMFAAAMLSTIGMVSLAIAMMLNKDILSYFKPFQNMTPKKESLLCRLWIVLAGISAAFVAVLIQAAVNTTITWGFSWFIPLFFMFIIGLYWKRSQPAAIVTIIVCWICNLALSFTNMAAAFNLEGNNHSIFLCVLSIVFGVIITALDKNAKKSFSQLYKEQRGAYDALKKA